MTNCPKCGSDTLTEREADRRTFCICLSCGSFAYEKKSIVGGYEVTMDEIAEDVADRGHHEAHTVILINTAFRARPGMDSHSQMKTWAAKHLLRFEQRGDMTIFERDGIALGRLLGGQ